MSSAGCYITGTGLVTCQGVGVAENWRNLLAGRVLHGTGIVPIECDPALPRVSQLAIHAAREALGSVGNPPVADDRTALVVGTSKGPIEDWIDQLNGRRAPDVTLGIARTAADIAAAVGHANGPRLTYAGACASGLHALIRASEMIKQGSCDRALVVAAEASTHALFAANFKRLGVLADPVEGCRPFDRRRHGFLLAEAAAAVWLTHEPAANAVRITAGHAFADATHITGTDRDGRSLRHLISRLTAADQPVDLIHAHGTGTILNDAVELDAIRSIRQRPPIVVCSHKHAIGHTQGAAGLIATVLNVEMHRHGEVLGNSNSPEPKTASAALNVVLNRSRAEVSVDHSLVIAAGFGGTVGGVRLESKWRQRSA